MTRGRRLRLLLIPLFTGLVAVALAYSYLGAEQNPEGPAPAPVVTVVATRVAILAHTRIEPEMLALVEVSPALAEGALREIAAVAGQFATMPMDAGEVVIPLKLSGPPGEADLSYRIPPGLRAFSVGVDEATGVGNHPAAGDRVDVIVVIGERTEIEQLLPRHAQLLAQDIMVLTKGQAGSAAAGGQVRVEGGRGAMPATYTLAVTPEQAVALSLAEEMGRIRLVLRPAGATEQVGPTQKDEFDLRAPAGRVLR